MTPDKLPVPLPPEPVSPKGFKALLQHQRFILVTLVILLFFVILFGLGLYRKAKTDTPGDIAKLEAAKSEGIPVFCDRYSYIAGATGLSSMNFPLWAKQGTTDEFLARLKDPTLESKFRAFLEEREEKLGSWDKVVISSVFTDKNKIFEGKSILEATQETGKDVFEFLRDLLIEEENRAGQVIFMMKEENLKRILAHPLVGVGCDGSALAPYGPLGMGKP